MKNRIKLCVLASISYACFIAPTNAELLFQDNFNVADTNTFDAASTSGRLNGTLSNVILVSARVQQAIAGNQLKMIDAPYPPGGTGRVKFVDRGGKDLFNWAAGASGTSILGGGGLHIEFDWTTPSTTTNDWIAFCFGHATGAVEPQQRVTNAQTDYGILLRGNGGSLRFDNGTSASTTGSFAASASQRHVVLEFAFTSFADGSAVEADVWVDGTPLDDYSFTFDPGDTPDVLNMELETSMTNMLIDNVSISTISEPPVSADLLFKDNFSTADGNLSTADIATRVSGTLAGDSTVWLQSANIVQGILQNRLNMQSGANKGRVRFGDGDTPFDWAAGATGASILGAGGMRIEFDWSTTPSINTEGWVAFCFGHATAPVEPSQRITNAQTDYGILLRGNGGSQRFDNGTATALDFIVPTLNQRHVMLDFAFTSFADGSPVDVKVWVDGILVDSYAFTFNPGDAPGVLNMELETSLSNIMLIDNYSVSLLPQLNITNTIVGWSPFSSTVMEMVVASSVPKKSFPVSCTDLVVGTWTNNVAHSTNGVDGFIVTNLDYSALSGTNRVIYLHATNAAAFFGISNE